MLNATFYLRTVLTWGSTWLAIKYQLGSLTGTPVSSASTVPDLLSLIPGFFRIGYCLRLLPDPDRPNRSRAGCLRNSALPDRRPAPIDLLGKLPLGPVRGRRNGTDSEWQLSGSG